MKLCDISLRGKKKREQFQDLCRQWGTVLCKPANRGFSDRELTDMGLMPKPEPSAQSSLFE